MEMTNREMIMHLNGLMAIQDRLGGELSYKVARNKNKLMKEYEQFDKARVEAKKSYCELDEQGNIKKRVRCFKDEQGKERPLKDENGNEIMMDVFLDEDKEKEWADIEKKMLDEEKCSIDIRMVKEEVVFNSDVSLFAADNMLFMIEEGK